MADILKAYSLSEVLIIVCSFALMIKGVVQFYDWAFERLKAFFKKEREETEISDRLDRGSRTMDALKEDISTLNEAIKELQKNQKELTEAITKVNEDRQALHKVIDNMNNNIGMLIESDKDDIKSYLTEKHHYYCYNQGWIDDYSLECCERRFKHYVDEGGNSFIERFMQELRNLPRQGQKFDKQ